MVEILDVERVRVTNSGVDQRQLIFTQQFPTRLLDKGVGKVFNKIGDTATRGLREVLAV